jgi:hypothetical protein
MPCFVVSVFFAVDPRLHGVQQERTETTGLTANYAKHANEQSKRDFFLARRALPKGGNRLKAAPVPVRPFRLPFHFRVFGVFRG